MWIPGNLWIFGAIAVLFFLWNREQEQDDVGVGSLVLRAES
jgi:hypothetical protein